jgi:hypothetical protein
MLESFLVSLLLLTSLLLQHNCLYLRPWCSYCFHCHPSCCLNSFCSSYVHLTEYWLSCHCWLCHGWRPWCCLRSSVAFLLLLAFPAVAGALLLLSSLLSQRQIQSVSVTYSEMSDYRTSSMGLISDHRSDYSINYRSIGYRTKASIYRIIGNGTDKKYYTWGKEWKVMEGPCTGWTSPPPADPGKPASHLTCNELLILTFCVKGLRCNFPCYCRQSCSNFFSFKATVQYFARKRFFKTGFVGKNLSWNF